MRVGFGYDVHRLVEDRPLILGGVVIPWERGLAGHSDADVLCHALMDALLGAAALGDIGSHFPDTDPKYAGADSLALLREVVSKLKTAGLEVGNIDTVICAQAPKLAPYIPDMRVNLASALGCDLSYVNVKATTTEKLGFVGMGEGLAAYAIVLLISAEGMMP